VRNKKLAMAGLASAVTIMSATAVYAVPGASTGPSSSQSPYLVRTKPGIVTKSILTVGDSVGGYKMAGIPDGLGAFDNGDGTFTVLMNHEIRNTLGVVRDHGAKGAFVSKWIIDNESLEVLSGDDLIQELEFTTGSKEINRLCSGDLPEVSAFYNEVSGLGTTERIFMSGEESGAEGRAFGHVVTGPDAGTSYELPYLGKFSWENAVAMPNSGDTTIVVGMDDGDGGQVYVYVGTKQATGNTVEKAGLTNGVLYGVQVTGVATEGNATSLPGGEAAFTLVPLGDVSKLTGAELNAASLKAGVTTFARPEDGSWDPSDPDNFYFATTASFTDISRVWKLSFSALADVASGGTASIAVQSPAYDPANLAGPRMMDNLTVNSRGQVIIQEDVGNQDYIGGVFQYEPTNGNVERIAQHDPARFTPGTPTPAGFLTKDEESSGIIPVPFLGEGKYLLDVQAHYGTGDPETVEGGQLLVVHIPPGKPVR
jgi:Bacterial protein of unknown function (DUF839)